MSTRLQGHWDQVAGKLKEKWAQLSDDELLDFEGNVQELIGFIELRTTDTREEIEKFVNEAVGESEGTLEQAQRVGREYAERSGEAISQAYESVQSGVRDGYVKAAEELRKRPVSSVAVAFGSGLVAGVLVALTMRSR